VIINPNWIPGTSAENRPGDWHAAETPRLTRAHYALESTWRYQIIEGTKSRSHIKAYPTEKRNAWRRVYPVSWLNKLIKKIGEKPKRNQKRAINAYIFTKKAQEISKRTESNDSNDMVMGKRNGTYEYRNRVYNSETVCLFNLWIFWRSMEAGNRSPSYQSTRLDVQTWHFIWPMAHSMKMLWGIRKTERNIKEKWCQRPAVIIS